MEQKELLHKYYVAGTMTLDKLFQVIGHLSSEGLVQLKDKLNPLKGEQHLYKLLGRSEPLTSSFLHERVNLEKLSKKLAEQGIPFAFKSVENGTNLFFRVNDQELAKNGLKQVVQSIGNQPEPYLKKPEQLTFDEKVTKEKQKIQSNGEHAPALKKMKGRQR